MPNKRSVICPIAGPSRRSLGISLTFSGHPHSNRRFQPRRSHIASPVTWRLKLWASEGRGLAGSLSEPNT
eukprot:1773108-Prymnesium_polylepis.1